MLTKLYVEASLFLDSLKKDQRGVTAIEYALVAASIAAIVALVFKQDATSGFGKALQDAIAKITQTIAGAAGAAGA